MQSTPLMRAIQSMSDLGHRYRCHAQQGAQPDPHAARCLVVSPSTRWRHEGWLAWALGTAATEVAMSKILSSNSITLKEALDYYENGSIVAIRCSSRSTEVHSPLQSSSPFARADPLRQGTLAANRSCLSSACRPGCLAYAGSSTPTLGSQDKHAIHRI